MVPFIARSMTKGAAMRSCRRPATKVVVFQWPCGTALTSRLPRSARPRRLAMLVVVPVSSMKTSRAGSRPGWPSFQAVRAAATSARACSAACAVFFKADAVSPVEAPDGGDRSGDPAFAQPTPDLRQGQEPLLDHRLLEFAATVPVARHACVSLTTKLGLTEKTAATARTLLPAITSPTTRSRRSTEYGFVIADLTQNLPAIIADQTK